MIAAIKRLWARFITGPKTTFAEGKVEPIPCEGQYWESIVDLGHGPVYSIVYVEHLEQGLIWYRTLGSPEPMKVTRVEAFIDHFSYVRAK